ncbi:hypothetical protein ACFU5O_28260 [Streptomyces sp. NPDC057445]|uniref:hypothetical protein n=1 Tax=Streptomyces sp. NPDC057445 TaxID=3346136 RepID=UPI00369C37C4
MQMTVNLDLARTEEATLRSEFFGSTDPDKGEVVLPGDIVLRYPKKRTRGGSSADILTAAQLVASIPAGVLANLATDHIRRYLQGKNTTGSIRRATISYIDPNGNPVTLHLEFADS